MLCFINCNVSEKKIINFFVSTFSNSSQFNTSFTVFLPQTPSPHPSLPTPPPPLSSPNPQTPPQFTNPPPPQFTNPPPRPLSSLPLPQPVKPPVYYHPQASLLAPTPQFTPSHHLPPPPPVYPVPIDGGGKKASGGKGMTSLTPLPRFIYHPPPPPPVYFPLPQFIPPSLHPPLPPVYPAPLFGEGG